MRLQFPISAFYFQLYPKTPAVTRRGFLFSANPLAPWRLGVLPLSGFDEPILQDFLIPNSKFQIPHSKFNPPPGGSTGLINDLLQLAGQLVPQLRVRLHQPDNISKVLGSLALPARLILPSQHLTRQCILKRCNSQ